MSDQYFFQERYKQAAAAIATELPAVADYIAPAFPADNPLRRETIRFIMEGGKRFRPALSFVVAQACGHDDVRVHLALEMFHKYLLTHDDIIDRDITRNGAPTVHAAFTESRKGSRGAQHFGNSLGIIAGDLMEAATQRIILEAQLPAETTRALQLLINQATNEVTWGWCDQFMMDYEPLSSRTLTEKRIEESLVWVTGRYSIKLPLCFGFTVACQPIPEAVKALADTLGLLYQTGDDVMGIFGDQAKTGKSNSGDLVQGKKTLPLWFAYQAAPTTQKNVLQRVVGNSKASDVMLAQARDIIRNYGLPRTETKMAQWKKLAHDQLEKLQPHISQELAVFLAGFIDFLVRREV